MRKNWTVAILLLSVLWMLIYSCQKLPQAGGADDKLSVLMDSTYMDSWRETILEIFGQIKEYPTPEREFDITFYDYSQYKEWSYQKNLMMVGVLGGADSVSRRLSALLSDSLKKQIREGKYFYFRKSNVYAKPQFVMYCIGSSPEDVAIQLYNYQDVMLSEFRNYYYSRLKQEMYSRAEQKDLEKEIFANYDFVLRIQHDYKIAAQNRRDNIVWFRRPAIDRNLFIHWIDRKDASFLHPDSIIAERNALGQKYFEGDYVSSRHLRYYKTKFSGKDALKIEGVWENKKYYIGGPFRTYAFHDSVANRIYMVDLFVFIPDRRKKYFLDQLEVMANTFRLKREIRSLEEIWN